MQLFPAERHRIANLMIERIDIVHAGEVQGIKVRWRELGWDALIGEFTSQGIGAELLEVEAARVTPPDTRPRHHPAGGAGAGLLLAAPPGQRSDA